MPARVEIDLNVRVKGNLTFTGVEDADGPVRPGDIVHVFESESGLEGTGRVESIDEDRRLIYLAVDWGGLRVPPPRQASCFGAQLTETQAQATASSVTSHRSKLVPTGVPEVVAVTCAA